MLAEYRISPSIGKSEHRMVIETGGACAFMFLRYAGLSQANCTWGSRNGVRDGGVERRDAENRLVVFGDEMGLKN